jgi:hypothetical protein
MVGSELLVLCPQEDEFTPGTFYMSVFATGARAQGVLRVGFLDTPLDQTVPLPCEIPAGFSLPSTAGVPPFACLQDGTLETGFGANTSQLLAYVVELQADCPQVYARLKPTDMFGSFNLLVGVEPDYSFARPLVVASTLRGGTISLSLCPFNTHLRSARLLVGVEVLAPGPFQLLVSSHAYPYSVPFANVTSASLFDHQLSGSILHFGDGSTEICRSLYGECAYYWNQKHSNPLSPLPQVFNWSFSDFHDQVFLFDPFSSTPEYLPNTVTGFLINRYDIGQGPVVVRSPALAETALMSFLGRFTNLAGEALVGDFSFTAKVGRGVG